MTARPITVTTAIRDYLLACEVESKAPTTLRWYDYMLKPLADAYTALPLAAITPLLMRQLLVILKKQERSPQTYSNQVRVLKTFWAWATIEYNTENPMRNIKTPPIPRSVPDVISVAQLRKLLEVTDNSEMGIRDRAILYTLADTGLRSAGLLGLEVANLYLDRNFMLITEKGGHTRAVPISTRTIGHLMAWLKIHPKGATRVFCSLRTRDRGRPLTNSGLRLILRRLARKAGLDESIIHPHAFRHFAALAMRQRGADVGVVAQIVGHTDVATTVHIYGQFNPEQLVEMHQHFSPLNLLEIL